MTICEKVAEAMWADTNDNCGGNWVAVETITQETYRSNACVAIATFLTAAAEEGWHMRPDEATETMCKAGIENAGDERGRTGGPDDAFKLIWRAMLDTTDDFEWEKPSKASK